MSQEWFQRIMNLVPKKLQKNEREIKRIHEEIKEDYAFAVKMLELADENKIVCNMRSIYIFCKMIDYIR